jgi:hypothetical protein
MNSISDVPHAQAECAELASMDVNRDIGLNIKIEVNSDPNKAPLHVYTPAQRQNSGSLRSHFATALHAHFSKHADAVDTGKAPKLVTNLLIM